MYAVILAGGGGTRLHPLSRPEHPKPFLPLVTGETLLQGTVARLAGVTDDVTVVTDRRYERLVRAQVPGAAMLLEPLGRNTAAAIALAALAIDRPDDEVMLVAAGRPDGRSEPASSAASCAAAATGWRPARSASRTRSSRSASRSTDRPPNTAT